jgi:hypothetical protein
MKLIRRSKSQPPAQKALGIARLALRGLVAQRVARKAFKGYKLARKLPLVIAGGAVAAFAAKKARGRGGQGPHDFATTPPPPQPVPTGPDPELTPDLSGAPAADGAPDVSPAAESGADVPDALAEAGAAPADPAAAAEGGSDAGDPDETKPAT